MKHLDVVNSFREELSRVSREVEISAKMGHFDINKVCEDLFCGVLKEVYNWPDLRNLNDEEHNFPGIDLADDSLRVAIQVSSDSSLDKVKVSIQKFLTHGLNEKYDRLIIYILTKKQGSYSQSSVDSTCNGSIKFDVNADILDYTDVATKASSISPQALQRALDVLHVYTRGCESGLSKLDFDPSRSTVETLTANLLEVYFPNNLYIAHLVPDALSGGGGKTQRNQRKQIRSFMDELGIIVPSDYEVNAGRLITFHDLEQPNNPFSRLIDEGTVELFSPSDFYSIDGDHERIFKSLLRFSLQHKLYKHRVMWQFKEKLFIFLPLHDGDHLRKESWIGHKKSSRMVFERKFQTKDPTKTLSTRHFAFSVDFLNLDSGWYVSLTPDWFFSFGDHYQRSGYGDKLLSGLKRMEKNRSVFDQFRFLCSWLNALDNDDLFSQSNSSSPTITFGKTLSCDGAPFLNESLWEPIKEEDSENYEPSVQRSFGI
ncbi:SMEK domain-containing protein [Thalassolituus oleivorans]|uniref:SMEK domain-containing protein n=1 Tax=Thalassolituus oleivorans TaxID=187493 RepID=UPI0030C8637A